MTVFPFINTKIFLVHSKWVMDVIFTSFAVLTMFLYMRLNLWGLLTIIQCDTGRGGLFRFNLRIGGPGALHSNKRLHQFN